MLCRNRQLIQTALLGYRERPCSALTERAKEFSKGLAPTYTPTACSPTLDIVSCLGSSGRRLLVSHWGFDARIPGDWGWAAFVFLLTGICSLHALNPEGPIQILCQLGITLPFFSLISGGVVSCKWGLRGIRVLQISFSHSEVICSRSNWVFGGTEVPVVINCKAPVFSF